VSATPSGTLAVLGAGAMAEALVQGMLRGGLWTPGRIRAADPAAARRALFTEHFGVATFDDNGEAVRGASVVLLAVKPQVAPAVLDELRADWTGERVLVSIAAGLSTVFFERRLGGEPRVVRTMPNTPALVGGGVAALCGGRHARPEDLDLAEAMLGAVGVVHRVEEAHMDAVTAVSGSGPAYVFYLAEAMIEAGRVLGLSAEVANGLVARTIEGAGRMLRETGLPPGELRRRVTSPRGTTEAAIACLDEGGVRAHAVAAVRAACRRAGELARDAEAAS
jgi:pyrroline-5-carboxylate reductase